MTKATVTHENIEKPSIFKCGNLVVTRSGVVVLVTIDRYDSNLMFTGLRLTPSVNSATGRFNIKGCKQFRGEVLLESPQ
jgi:hypothetical protein